MRAIVILTLVVGCADPAEGPPPDQSRVEIFELPRQGPAKLDLLIVLDNTRAMAPYVPRLDDLVRAIDGGSDPACPMLGRRLRRQPEIVPTAASAS